MSDLTAFIFARGGSKGLPGKNIKPIAGKPLLAWAIETALQVSKIGRVIVSTDDEEIAAVARDFGAQVPFLRPESLATDTVSEWQAWQHALTTLAGSEGQMSAPFISVPTTSPLRLPEDIENCIDTYQKGDADAVICVTDSARSPWFNMVSEKTDGSFAPVNSDGEGVVRRQDAPTVFDVTTVCYVADPEFILRTNGLFEGRVNVAKVPAERSIDIDTPYDFEIAEFLLKKRIESQ